MRLVLFIWEQLSLPIIYIIYSLLVSPTIQKFLMGVFPVVLMF